MGNYHHRKSVTENFSQLFFLFFSNTVNFVRDSRTQAHIYTLKMTSPSKTKAKTVITTNH